MSAWEDYPADYRKSEIQRILTAVQAGECVAVIGLSGAGKSNLVGFLYHRAPPTPGLPAFLLLDGNRAQPRTWNGLIRLIGQALVGPVSQIGDLTSLESALERKISRSQDGLCLLFDRYDALSPEERALASGPLRAMRDEFKYQLTFVITTRRLPEPNDELAELFYANTLWLGPLSPPDARWSVEQYIKRRSLAWEEAAIAQLIRLSGGYPSLLRACCEAWADAGNPAAIPDFETLRDHPAVQRRVLEFWADRPTPEDLRRSGLARQPLLSTAQSAVSAESPDLTASEHRLLAWFQAHPGEVCGKDDLIRAVWPEDRVIDGLRDDSLAQLIRRLRQKIGAMLVQTIPGRGYRYAAE